jgi:hypothetical protein
MKSKGGIFVFLLRFGSNSEYMFCEVPPYNLNYLSEASCKILGTFRSSSGNGALQSTLSSLY